MTDVYVFVIYTDIQAALTTLCPFHDSMDWNSNFKKLQKKKTKVKMERSPRQIWRSSDLHMEIRRRKDCWKVRLKVAQVLLMCYEKSRDRRAVMEVDACACKLKMHEQRGDTESGQTRCWLFIKWQRSIKDGGWEERGGGRLRGGFIP